MSSATDDDGIGRAADSLPLSAGAVGGAGAYLLGYVLAYLWKGAAYRDALSRIGPIVEAFGGNAPPPWKVVGWLYYSAHFVQSRVSVGPVSTYVNLVAQTDGVSALYLVPPLFLLGAGYLVASRTDAASAVDGAKAGATVVVGYFVLALVGAFVVRVGGSGPELVPAALLAGVVYPAVFGGVGGAVAASVDR